MALKHIGRLSLMLEPDIMLYAFLFCFMTLFITPLRQLFPYPSVTRISFSNNKIRDKIPVVSLNHSYTKSKFFFFCLVILDYVRVIRRYFWVCTVSHFHFQKSCCNWNLKFPEGISINLSLCLSVRPLSIVHPILPGYGHTNQRRLLHCTFFGSLPKSFHNHSFFHRWHVFLWAYELSASSQWIHFYQAIPLQLPGQCKAHMGVFMR